MQKRLAYIDGLRAIAVLSVAVFHARVHVLGPDLEMWAKECAHGVDLFFILSGFCLSYPTIEKLTNGDVRFDTIGYALKRFLRIFPPYAAALGLCAGGAAIAASRGVTLPPGLNGLSPALVFDNLFFLDAAHTYVNDSFWSLGIEFRWYFLFPIALLLAVRNMRAFIATIFLVAIAGELTRAGSTDVGVLPAFLLGIVAAFVHVRDHRIVRYVVPLGIVAFVFAMGDERRPHYPLNTNVGWHAVAFCFVIAAGAWPWLRAALSFKPLTQIGVASYSIYLVHEPIVSWFVTGPWRAQGDPIAATAGVAAGVCAGFVLWAILERPLTQPGLVRAFVAKGRWRMDELFAVAGVPASFVLSVPGSVTHGNLTLAGHGFPKPALKEEAV